jgi:hypothetical protein
MNRLNTLLLLLALGLFVVLAACSETLNRGGDDDDSVTPGDDDDDDDDDDDTSGDDDTAGDDDTSGDAVYDGPPKNLNPGATWQEARDGADAEVYSGFTIDGYEVAEGELPPAEGIAQDLGAVSVQLSENVLTGRIDSIVSDTWDGDNDAYKITFTNGGFVHFILEWDDALADDYDARLYCEYEDDQNDLAIYSMPTEPDLADLSIPEAGITPVELNPGRPCWFFVVGYTGESIEYTMTIIPETGDAPPVGDDDDSAGDDDDSASPPPMMGR